MSINSIFFKYCVYLPVVFLRKEWVMGHISRLEKTQYDTIEVSQKCQLSKLNQLLGYAKKNCDYYKDIPERIDSLSDLNKIPMLEKADLREKSAQLKSREKRKFVRSKTTGGSTGAPITLLKDADGMALELAATWRGYRWANIDIGDKQARFWGVPQSKAGRRNAKLIDLITNRRRFSAFNFSESSLERYLQEINKLKPIYFYGYVSLLREFAKYIEDSSLAIKSYPKAIITTSEVLSEADRELLQRVFCCKVYNEYGCGEVGTIAHECEHGNMHITAENMIVECVDEQGNAAVSGEIVVTDLINYSMPLIRYKIKDFGSISASTCQCGRHLPVLNEVFGREYDMLINPDGQKFHGEFFLYYFEDLKKQGLSVRAFQIRQVAPDKIALSLIADEKTSAAVKDGFEKYLQSEFHASVTLCVDNLSSLPREQSGKFRLIKREFG